MTTTTGACTGCKGIAADDPRFVTLDQYIASAIGTPGSLISVLHHAQQLFGFLPQEVQNHVAVGLQIPPSEVYGVVTFYNLFNTDPVGQFPISVCMGTACYVRGADRILAQIENELGIKPGQVAPDGVFSLEVCRCIGACGLAPVITIGGEVHGKLNESETRKLLAAYRQQSGVANDAADAQAEREPVAVGSEA